jgi:hypothetical protein
LAPLAYSTGLLGLCDVKEPAPDWAANHFSDRNYLIINADSIDEAEKIAQSCPIITSVRVYEAMSM